ncbi:MAG: hypothetical protein HQM12_11405 [SAR324 cluster bacterium]|nr:hypothetical protein [SAR324 cluster bacterium]
MFEKSDVLEAYFRYSDDILVHNCIVRLQNNNEVKQGVRFGITVSADARVGKELTMILSDISHIEQIKLKVTMITTEHLENTSRGWFSIVEVMDILEKGSGLSL